MHALADEGARRWTLGGTKWVIFALAFAAAAFPFVAPDNISLVDYPNHLARFHIAQAVGEDSRLAEIYELKTGFFPYYGMQILMTALSPIMGVEPAGRVFAAIAVLMPAFGALVLSRVIHGRVSWVALAAVALTMNALVGWGFLNFVFSIGVALVVLALWIRAEGLSLPARALVFAPLIFLTGCVHLLSAGILFGLIGAWEIAGVLDHSNPAAAARQALRKLPALLILAASVALLLALAPEEGVGGWQTAWGGITSRLEVVAAAFAVGRGRLETLLGLAAILPVYVAWREQLLVLPPRFGRMLVLVFGAALVAPVLVAGVYALHIRLPIFVALIFLSALSPRPGLSRPGWERLLLACFVAATALHFALGARILAAESDRIAELRQAAHVIPRGAKVFPAIDQEAAGKMNAGSVQSLFHVASFLVIDRSVFLPTLFGMYELGVTPTYRTLFPVQASPTSYSDLLDARFANGLAKPEQWERLEAYDFVVVLARDRQRDLLPGTKLVHAGSWFEILEVAK